MPPVPKITKWFLIVLTAVFFVSDIGRMATGVDIRTWLALYPLSFSFQPWQVFTYVLVHGDIVQLLFNLLGLWIFGAPLEHLWNDKRYLQFITACGLTAALIELLLTTLTGRPSMMVGVNSIIYGLLLAQAMLFPNKIVNLVIPPVQMTMKTYVIVFGVLELWVGLHAQDLVAHFAHLGGMLGAFLMIRYWRGQPPFKGRRRF
jgi:membrane associated rhomboid family serine protease